MKPRRETEIKLRANGRSCTSEQVLRIAEGLGMPLERTGDVDQLDVYLDDAQFHLTRAGIGLRLRRRGSSSVLCVKTERPREGRAFERDEVEIEIDAAPPARAHHLPDALRDRIEPYVLHRRLRPIAGLRTQREILATRGFEVALDAVIVQDDDGVPLGSFAEIEIELKDDGPLGPAEALADELRSAFGLVDASGNKLQRALRLLEVELGDDSVGKIGADRSMAEAARLMIARHFARMQRAEVDVRTSGKAGSVHRLRVACRRIRSTLRTFRPWLDAELHGDLRDAVRDTARAFGAVRDLDVLAADLRGRQAQLHEDLRRPAKRVVRRLKRRARDLRDAGRAVLRSPERLASVARLQDYIEAAGEADDGPTIAANAGPAIRAATDAVFARGRQLDGNSPAEDLHALRILIKRLRYTAECFTGLYGRDLARFVERVTHLQEVLGEFNDAMTATDILLELGRGDAALRRRGLIALGGFMSLQQRRAVEARQRFHTIWAEFDSDDLRVWFDAALRGLRR